MERVALQLRIKAGREDEYDEIHRHVWPDLISELESLQVADYSIFRRGKDLFLYLRVPGRNALFAVMAASEVNQR